MIIQNLSMEELDEKLDNLLSQYSMNKFVDVKTNATYEIADVQVLRSNGKEQFAFIYINEKYPSVLYATPIDEFFEWSLVGKIKRE